MAHQAIYRKWRPLVFEDLIGQNHISQTLKNQIVNNKTAHAYLFCGTRGTGKTSAAKIFARAVNCLNNTSGSPCNECEICRGILNGSVLDVLEIDAASNNGVDNIRDIKDEINYPPSTAKYRVYIIDEVHMLSIGAFNALLKTLEEPPEYSIFILATTEPHKVPVTILSRCQRFDFKRIKTSDITVRIKEIAFKDGYNITDDAASLLAALGDGSMRDALSIMERCLSASGGTLSREDINSILGIASVQAVSDIADAVIVKDTAAVLKILDQALSDGKDINVFIADIIKYLRSMLICKLSDNIEELDGISREESVKIKAQAEKISFEKLSAASSLLSAAQADAKWVKSPRLIYEMAFVKLCRPELDDSPAALLSRLSDMEQKLKDGVKIVSEKESGEKKAKTPAKKKPLPSKRAFSPIDSSQLTASHPFAAAAKKWDKVIKEIMKNAPHLITPLRDKSVTIDSEGIVIMYEEKDRFAKNIADSMLSEIEGIAVKVLGTELRVKTIFKKDIEDFIVDFWNLPDKDISGGDTPSPANTDQPADPIDRLAEKFPEIVEFTDDSEFLNFKSDMKTEQSVMDFN